MGSVEVSPFERTTVETWLQHNGMENALRVFRNGLEWFEKAGSFDDHLALKVWVNTSCSESWIGGVFAGICARNHTCFVPPGWKRDQIGDLRQVFSPDIILGDEGWMDMRRTTHDLGAEVCSSIFEPDGNLLIPTGGSSGRTKFAIHPVENMVHAVAGLSDYIRRRSPLDFTGSFNYTSDLPVWHVSGWMQVVRSFLSHSKFFMGNRARERWKEDCVSEKWISVVPTQLNRLLQHPEGRQVLCNANYVLVGGGRCSETILQTAIEYGVPLWMSYGMTETLGVIASKPIFEADDIEKGADVLPHAEVCILNKDGAVVRNGEGEVGIGSKSLCRGYLLTNPGETSRYETLSAQLWKSRDCGSFDAEGKLTVTGRVDDLINSGGEKVNPVELEKLIIASAWVDDCKVVGVADEDWGQRVVCVLVPSGDIDKHTLTEILQNYLRPKIEAFKIPKRWVIVDALPVNHQGKIEKNQILHLIKETVAK